MLKRIKSIKNLRNLIDFNCDEEFSRHSNVIYALNGTGKTSLSRFFSCFQGDEVDVAKLKEYLSLEAEDSGTVDFLIEFDGSVVSSSNLKLPLKQKVFVYNEDFLKANLEISDFCENKKHKGDLVLGTVGADEIKIKSIAAEIYALEEKHRQKTQEVAKELGTKLDSFKKNYNAKGTTYASIFSFERYLDSSQMEAIRLSLSSSNPKQIFKEIESINEDDKITNNFALLNPNIDFSDLRTTIQQGFTFEETKKEIEDHINKIGRDWVQKGLDNHTDDKCPFCLQSTHNLNVIKLYDDYIKSKKSKLIAKLESVRESIRKMADACNEIDKLVRAGLKEKIEGFVNILDLENRWKDIRPMSQVKNEIQGLIDLITSKINNLENTFSERQVELENWCNTIESFVINVDDSSIENNATIAAINSSLVSTTVRKTELRKQIANHELVQYFDNSKSNREELLQIEQTLETKKIDLRTEKSKSQTKEVRKFIVDLQNKLLAKAGLTKYTINDNFELNLKSIRSFDISKKTRLISQGEKSVIAFTYFLAQIAQRISQYDEFANSLIVIDDPVSSTSYNYLHGLAAILKDLSNIYKTAYGVTGDNKTPQVLVTTHSIQFYNILTSNVYKKNGNFYELYTLSDGRIELIKQANDRKLSEYMTSLRRLVHFVNGAIDENIANDLRKVMETICSFYMHDVSQDSLQEIFGKEISSNLKLIADDHVHTDFNNFEDPIDGNSLKLAANELVALIESKFPKQLKYLHK